MQAHNMTPVYFCSQATGSHILGTNTKLPGKWRLLLASLLLCTAFGCGGGAASGGGGGGGGGSSPQNPVPALSGLTPNYAIAGSAGLSIAASGSGFISSSVILWNGTALATTYTSSTALSAQIPGSDLGTPGTATIAVQSPAPGGGTSSTITFNISISPAILTVLNVAGSDVAWNSSQQKLYVAVPSSASSNPGTITIADPVAGSIVSSQQMSSAPSGLAISDDDQFLYVVMNGATTIQRLNLPALTSDIQWSLGTDSSSGNPYLAGDIKVQPLASHTVAVSFGDYGSGSVAVFDDGVERSSVASSGAADNLGNSLQWDANGNEIYAAYTLCNDGPYFTTVSNDALYIMPVTSAGVGSITTYDATFRQEGCHLQSDPITGNVYGDWGQVFNSANGVPIGNYAWNRPNDVNFPGPLSVVDPTLDKFFTLLQVDGPNGNTAFQIQAFDQTNFQLLGTIVIPNAVGQPTNFIRWASAGLAFVTNTITSNSPGGQLYIVDGSFVNSNSTGDTLVGTPLVPVPALAAISPTTATEGSQALTLTLTGSNFIGQPTVYWNGNALVTTLLNNTELSAQIPASDLTSVGQAMITVSNAGSAFPASNALPFSVDPAPPSGNQIAIYNTGGNDLVWDATAAKIYVSMPGVQDALADTIAIVDPIAGTVTNTALIGSDPANLSIASDGQSLYVALYGQNEIEQLALPNFSVETAWNLGGVGTFSGPYYALDLQAAPGAAPTTAVVLANFDVSPSPAAVVIYDGPAQGGAQLQVTEYPYSSLQWNGSNDSLLYAVDQQIPQDFLVLGVSSSGVTLDESYPRIVNAYSPRIHYDAGAGLVYTDGGQVIQPSDGSVIGSFGASGIAVPDFTLNSVFILGQTPAQTGTSSYTIESFDQTTFASVGSIVIDNVVGAPTGLIRWGTNGLAFTTRIGMPSDFTAIGSGQLYVVSGNFVSAADSASKHSSIKPTQHVQRTWNLGRDSYRTRSTAVNVTPLQR